MEIPRQEVVDFGLRMAGDDALEDGAEIDMRIDAAQLGGFDERGDDAPIPAALVMTGILVYCDGRFTQVIEGAEPDIRNRPLRTATAMLRG